MRELHLFSSLRKIAGPRNVFTEPEELVVYSYDATRVSSLPVAVVRPASSAEISSILRLANQEGVAVVPRGAGTGMSGGSVPVRGGIVLSFERMNRILEIDEHNRIAVVEPGVVTGDFQREVESRGLFYPPDPASSRFCTMGGNVAECAGGLRAVKYGVTRDYVLGLEAVLPTGEIISTGARTLKSVAGYDLTRLLVGSEGTLGVVTKIIVRLLPLPESVGTAAAFFPDVRSAVNAVLAIGRTTVMPRALEFVDSGALEAASRFLKDDLADGAGAMLLFEADGPPSAVKADIETMERLCVEAGSVRTLRAATEGERERLWKLRRSISPALYTIKPNKLNEDIVVPVGSIAEMLGEIERTAAAYGLMIVSFGHAGDGNIHVNVMIDEDERPRAEQAVADIFRAALRLRGSITGEHGIGIAKAAYLPLEAGEAAIGAMRRIKQALDPRNILNPGKIFSDVAVPSGEAV